MVRLRTIAAALGVASVLVPLSAGVALAHDEMDEPTPSPTVAAGPADAHLEPADLALRLPESIRLGTTISVSATLTDRRGMPIEGATIAFERPGFWGEGLNGHMLVGQAVTDENGVATITDEIRTSGDVDIEASFAGDGVHAQAMAEGHVEVVGDRQLYHPTAGLRVPWLNLWVLAGVIALVWFLYLVVGSRVVAIARAGASEAATGSVVPASAPPNGVLSTRRQFLGRALPFGAEAGIGMLGATLVTIVARSPHTHGNLMSAPATEATYRRTPVAFVGGHADMRDMPMPLEREVSFAGEVLPIFLANGGPHVAQPKNSPPPGGFRLDSYEHVLAKEGVVVPGKPEESELIEHLLTPAMQMPPSVPPLPEDQIQLIVTWIAQGAKQN